MKIKKVLLISILACCSLTATAQKYKPTNLMTDMVEHSDKVWKNGYLTSVDIAQVQEGKMQYAGIASSRPTFGWIVNGSQGTLQKSYRIQLGESRTSVAKGDSLLWDSGVVESDKSVAQKYNGTNPLKPNKTYYWRVRVITNTGGTSEWSDVKAFRTNPQLAEYGVSFYPQVKSVEYPVTIEQVSDKDQFIDFGKAAFAQLSLTLTSEFGGDTVWVHLGELNKGKHVDRNPGGTIRYQCSPLVLMKGTHTYTIDNKKDKRNTGAAAVLIPEYIGEVLPFRYCELEGYNSLLASPQIMRESVHYPFDDYASSFSCSNDTLNQIWDMCKYSIKATSFLGIYVDGDRERIPYEADAIINQLSHYGVDREYSMARRSSEYLLEHPTWPTEWILQATIIAWNDYLYTGDSRSFQKYYDLLAVRTLNDLKGKNGLISTRTNLITTDLQRRLRFNGKIRDIVDWPWGGKEFPAGEIDSFEFTDYNTVVNAFHGISLKIMSDMAYTLGKKSETSKYDDWYKKHNTVFLKSLYSDSVQRFVDGIGTEHSSLHANMFPLALGLVPVKNQRAWGGALEFIKTRDMACSVYGSQFLLDALYNGGEADYALKMLTKGDDRGWYNMIRVGSTISLEAWDNKYKPNQDWNHAWGAAPANIIPRKLLGVEPAEPGYGVASIRPQIGSLEWAKGVVPTIRGSVEVDVKQSEEEYNLKILIPSNMKAQVYLPVLWSKCTIVCNGKEVKRILTEDKKSYYINTLNPGEYTIVMTNK